MKTFTFIKEDNKWYIDLPEFLTNGGSKGDLEMVMGADIMLERYAQGRLSVALYMDTVPFPGADVLDRTEICPPPEGGGAWYHMAQFSGMEVNQEL